MKTIEEIYEKTISGKKGLTRKQAVNIINQKTKVGFYRASNGLQQMENKGLILNWEVEPHQEIDLKIQQAKRLFEKYPNLQKLSSRFSLEFVWVEDNITPQIMVRYQGVRDSVSEVLKMAQKNAEFRKSQKNS